jgi:hypothetical protein
MREAEVREQELHKMFPDCQRQPPYTVGSEWFESTPELLELIQNEGKTLEQANPNLSSAREITRLFVSRRI